MGNLMKNIQDAANGRPYVADAMKSQESKETVNNMDSKRNVMNNLDGSFKLCKVTDDITTVPDVQGLAVWTDGRIDVYVGGEYTIEIKRLK